MDSSASDSDASNAILARLRLSRSWAFRQRGLHVFASVRVESNSSPQILHLGLYIVAPLWRHNSNVPEMGDWLHAFVVSSHFPGPLARKCDETAGRPSSKLRFRHLPLPLFLLGGPRGLRFVALLLAVGRRTAPGRGRSARPRITPTDSATIRNARRMRFGHTIAMTTNAN